VRCDPSVPPRIPFAEQEVCFQSPLCASPRLFRDDGWDLAGDDRAATTAAPISADFTICLRVMATLFVAYYTKSRSLGSGDAPSLGTYRFLIA